MADSSAALYNNKLLAPRMSGRTAEKKGIDLVEPRVPKHWCSFFLSHLNGLTFPCNTRETAAWQMFTVVNLFVVSVFATDELLNMTKVQSPYVVFLCRFNRMCQLLHVSSGVPLAIFVSAD